jgi:hypothetical protein
VECREVLVEINCASRRSMSKQGRWATLKRTCEKIQRLQTRREEFGVGLVWILIVLVGG